jgi:hypothetical protein
MTYVSEENPVRVIDVFVDELDFRVLGFAGIVPEATGRPVYHPGLLLKIYIYGYINQIGSSRSCRPRRTSRSHCRTRMLGPWRPAVAAVVSSATTCKPLSMRSIT